MWALPRSTALGTLGAGAGFRASASNSTVHNDYASVRKQSGIRAGDGGFQIQVGGNTDLKGGVISSTHAAIDAARNSLSTTTLSFVDVQNRDASQASGISLGVNVGKNQSGDTFSPSLAPGVGKVSESASSVTRSGVSAANLTVEHANAAQALAGLSRDVVTGKDTTEAFSKAWTGAQALDNVGAQMQITSAAMPRLAKEIGDYAATKRAELSLQGKLEEAAKWAEGGIYRVAAHAALGAMVGGTSSALAATAVTASTPKFAEQISWLAVSDEVKDAATLAAGDTIGLIVGGQNGAAPSVNEVADNYLSRLCLGFNKPSEQTRYENAVVECSSGNAGACKTRDDLIRLSQKRDLEVAAVCSRGPSSECHDMAMVA